MDNNATCIFSTCVYCTGISMLFLIVFEICNTLMPKPLFLCLRLHCSNTKRGSVPLRWSHGYLSFSGSRLGFINPLISGGCWGWKVSVLAIAAMLGLLFAAAVSPISCTSSLFPDSFCLCLSVSVSHCLHFCLSLSSPLLHFLSTSLSFYFPAFFPPTSLSPKWFL